MEEIRNLWVKGGYTPPTITIAYNEEAELFLVLSDESTIIRLMNIKSKIYAVAKFRCKSDEAKTYYVCGNPMHIISCTKTLETDKEKYAAGTVLPYLLQLASRSR